MLKQSHFILQVLLVFFFMADLAMAGECGAESGLATSFGNLILDEPKSVNRVKPKDILEISSDNFSYSRLLLKLNSFQHSGWRLVLRDDQLRPLQIIGREQFSNGAGSTIWTKRFRKTSKIYFDLRFTDPKSSAEILMPKYILMPLKTSSPFYSKQSKKAGWKDLTLVHDGWSKIGDSVGMLVGGKGTKSWCCTGAIIANKPHPLFLTNFHCGAPNRNYEDERVWNEEAIDGVCENTVIDFSWDGDDVPIEFACEQVVHRDPVNDIAVLRLRSLGPNASPPALSIRSSGIDSVASLNILHHPECSKKKISATCPITKKKVPGWRKSEIMSDFRHECDTEGGSSGGPVLDDRGRLIGVHHLGFARKPDNSCDMQNKGVRVDAFLPGLRANSKIEGLRQKDD